MIKLCQYFETSTYNKWHIDIEIWYHVHWLEVVSDNYLLKVWVALIIFLYGCIVQFVMVQQWKFIHCCSVNIIVNHLIIFQRVDQSQKGACTGGGAPFSEDQSLIPPFPFKIVYDCLRGVVWFFGDNEARVKKTCPRL